MKYVCALFKILHPLNEFFEAVSLQRHDLSKVKTCIYTGWNNNNK